VTAAADSLRRLIAANGPVTIARFMSEALGHPEHGYYITRDPLGAAGDFTTAPEISQMFGELLGLWCVDIWQGMGAPAPVILAEAGPGRGTLMADALRASALVPAFRDAARVHLVETSPALRQRQAEALCDYEVEWHSQLADLPDGPLLLMANEFLDALPIHQFQRSENGWRERLVAAEADGFELVLAGEALPPGALPTAFAGAAIGDIAEIAPAREGAAMDIAGRISRYGGAALLIDYGHAASAPGDTLQAVRAHAYCGILEDPGRADLTSHVDFEAVARAARRAGAAVHGPVTQGAFLQRLGIEARADRLKAGADTRQAADIDAALHRLTAPEQMGSLFKVIALTHSDMPAPAGF
jgi:NADH dehydrogenase [ubiquinone] 1 alpha subcomplex assembly factor 7